MLAALSCLVALQGTALTYEQFLTNVHDEYTKLTGYRETWTLTQLPREEEDTPLKFTREIDGPRARMRVFSGSKLAMDVVVNDRTWLAVLHAGQRYTTYTGDKPLREEPFKLPAHDSVEPDSFQLQFDQIYGPAVVFNPAPKVQSLTNVKDNGKSARLLTMATVVQEAPAEIKIWLQPERWMITRIEISSNLDGQKKQTMLRAAVEENVKFGRSAFSIDPKSYRGYTQVEYKDGG